MLSSGLRTVEALINKVSLTSLSEKVDAGEKLSAQITWNLANSEVLDHWDDIELTALLSNHIPGSAPIESSYKVKDKGSFISLSSDINFDIPRNVVGLYEFVGVKFIARSTKNTPLCYTSRIRPANKPKVIVNNDLAHVDIFPPNLYSFHFEPATAKPGDTVKITFQADDQSSLCTQVEESLGKCVGNWHQSITSEDGETWLYFDAALGGPTIDGKYTFLFQIPGDAQAGRYVLNQIFVRDVWDNFVVSPDTSVRPSLTIE